jgi:hypothetical protein
LLAAWDVEVKESRFIIAAMETSGADIIGWRPLSSQLARSVAVNSGSGTATGAWTFGSDGYASGMVRPA